MRKLAFAMTLALPLTLGAAELSPQRKLELLRLITQDCGSCHGSTRRGGLGPAITAEALRGKPSAGLEATILEGRPGTPMASWKPLLTPEEVRFMVTALTTGMTSHD